MTDYYVEYSRWCRSPLFDRQTQQELLAITDRKEIEDRFYRPLTFGTGGLRGEIGAGINRLNRYTIGKATQGLANFLNESQGEKSVVIAHDSRRMSLEFALETALVFAANGIRAYLFDSLRPTPMLSFAVRYLKADAGVVITASHNPAQYNGYKVYLSDGGQIVPPNDRLIIEAVNAVPDFSAIRRMEEGEARARRLLLSIGKEVDDAYMQAIRALVLSPEAIAREAKNLCIVYSPLYGAGNLPVRRILQELGFERVHVVSEQENPDGNFPTTPKPNPEREDVFALALALARRVDADLILATDPDADRLGVYVKDEAHGTYCRLTGNQSGLLIAQYELERKAELGLLPQNRRDGALISTIVSSKMADAMCRAFGLTHLQTLTGFKYIGALIHDFELARAENGGAINGAKGAYEYIFGFEESYGCLIGTYARDKDAVSAVMALCEAAAYYRTQGLSLWQKHCMMEQTYGYYREGLVDRTYEGADGMRKIKGLMAELRKVVPELNCGKIISVRDYLAGTESDERGNVTQLSLPQSDVLYYELEGGSWFCVRPSGTEPKIKLYFGVCEQTEAAAEHKLAAMREELSHLLE